MRSIWIGLAVLSLAAPRAWALTMSNELSGTAADKQASSAETYSLFLHTDGDWRIKGATGTTNLGTVGGTLDHGALGGLADDDHTQYLNSTRHGVATTHTSAFNNTLPISGDVNSKATLGAHVADAAMHWPRPAQTLTVAKNGTGQYATIAAALAVANAAAGSSTPYIVDVYPGVYDEAGLTLGNYVSLHSIVPQQAFVQSVSASALLTIEGTSVVLGMRFEAPSGDALLLSGAGMVTLDNVIVQQAGTGYCLNYDGANKLVTIANNSLFVSATKAIVANKNYGGLLDARDSTFGFYNTAGIASVIDIDAGAFDRFSNCRFLAPNIDHALSCAVIDFAGTRLDVIGCTFELSAPLTQVTAILASAGTVNVLGTLIDWDVTTGTPYDFNAGAGAAIYHAGCVYDESRVTGAGTVSFLRQGALGVESIDSSGRIVAAGDAGTNALIEVEPDSNGVGITVIPSGAIGAGETAGGLTLDLGDADPSGAGATVFGASIDLGAVSQTNDPDLVGLLVEMPAAYSGAGDMRGAELAGDGRTLRLVDENYALDGEAESGPVGRLTVSDATTDVSAEGLRIKHMTSGDMAAGFGAALGFAIEDDAGAENLIAQIEGVWNDADDYGSLQLKAGAYGGELFIDIQGSAGNVDFPLALGSTQALQIGSGPELYNDAAGLVINDEGQDSLWTADTIYLRLGDNAGVESVIIEDSDSATVASIDSNGKIFSPRLVNGLDSNTFVDFPITQDEVDVWAGGIKFVSCTEAATDEVAINNGGLDVDFRVEKNGGANAFAIDGATGEFKLLLYSQDAEPSLSADGYGALWMDTNDSNRIYLVFRRGSGDQVMVELL